MSSTVSLVGEPFMPDAAVADKIRRAVADGDTLRRLEPRLVKISLGFALPSYHHGHFISGNTFVEYAGERDVLTTEALSQNDAFAAAAWRSERTYGALGREIYEREGHDLDSGSVFLLLLPGMAFWIDQDFLLDEPDEFAWRAVEGRSVLRPTPSTGTAHEMLAAESCVRRYLPDLARAFDECVAENSDE